MLMGDYAINHSDGPYKFVPMKVFIVLDNLWTEEQRRLLLPDGLLMPKGSIVIMTSRIVTLLDHEHYNVIRKKVEGLPDGLAAELLCKHAFSARRPEKDVPTGPSSAFFMLEKELEKDLAEDPSRYAFKSIDGIINLIVQACHGIPLALRIIGKYLWGKHLRTWVVSSHLLTCSALVVCNLNYYPLRSI